MSVRLDLARESAGSLGLEMLELAVDGIYRSITIKYLGLELIGQIAVINSFKIVSIPDDEHEH